MKTCLFTPCFLTGLDEQGDSRLERYKRFIAYYQPLKTYLGFEDFILIDNASQWTELRQLNPTVLDAHSMRVLREGQPDLKIIQFAEHLSRKSTFDYPYVWRALYAVLKIIPIYDRIIFNDSDGFVLSKRFAEWLKTRNTGWSVPWCERWGFPEANISVLCRDMYPALIDMCQGDFMQHNGKCFEKSVPYTHIERGFNVGRYGEENLIQKPWMDFYAQARLRHPLSFEGQ